MANSASLSAIDVTISAVTTTHPVAMTIVMTDDPPRGV
jgi:hypothetical protein